MGNIKLIEMKTAIVTGASGNLGQAVVKKFIDEGYKVIGTIIPNDQVPPRTKDGMTSLPPDASGPQLPIEVKIKLVLFTPAAVPTPPPLPSPPLVLSSLTLRLCQPGLQYPAHSPSHDLCCLTLYLTSPPTHTETLTVASRHPYHHPA